MNIDLLRDMIRSSFSIPEHSKDKLIITGRSSSLEALGVQKFFFEKHWSQISLYDLKDIYNGDASACLSFMSDEGALYYLPTFLLAVLEDACIADVITDSLVSFLAFSESNKERFETWSEALTYNKIQVVRDFLNYIIEHDSIYELSSEANKAKLSFWDQQSIINGV